MKLVDKVSKDRRLSWNRKGGLVLTAFLERVGLELTAVRLRELTRLSNADLANQLQRFIKGGVLTRRTDLEAFPAEDYFLLPQEMRVRARTTLQLADDAELRELTEERGLDIEAAFGRFSTRQPYKVALGKALRDVRNDLTWSLTDVATVAPVQVSVATLSNYECGVTLPTPIMVAQLARLYGVNAVDLIVHAACHSKTDKRVQQLKIADPTFRAVLTHLYAAHDQQ
ncbi:helix-turn-helix domain-containing protein [Lentzea kentuckyensis]|uniref:helix-turn-helix domain-containing protein n=1 Tax=Lentzea kentuckyensis TaxID=360086 RepID=UPI000A396B8A|nr:helix-turn-helix transcriptional regulator [Lentzea kentuckyensis]